MKTMTGLVFLILAFLPVTAAVVGEFPNLLNPDRMLLTDGEIFIQQEFSVLIFSMPDLSLIKSVGKKGEGPGEFVGYVNMTFHGDRLYINSAGKLSVYLDDGTMIREVKSTESTSGGFLPLKNKFIGSGLEMDEERNRFRLLNMYNEDLVREKTMIREPLRSNFEKGTIIVFDTTFAYHVFGDRLYLVNGRDFKIDIYDSSLKKEKTITHDYERIRFGEKDEQKVIENLRTNPNLKEFAEEILKRQKYPDFYPAILGLYDNGENLFVMTHRWEGSNIEFLIFSGKGDFIQQLFIPFKMKSIYRGYPWDVKGDRFYQILENEDEEWELHEQLLDLKTDTKRSDRHR